MNSFDNPVTGKNGEWSVEDAVGEATRWKTYRGTDSNGNRAAIRTPTGEIPEHDFERFDTLARQWAAVNEYRAVRTLLDWGTEPRPWIAVEYSPNELETWGSGTAFETATACDLRTRAELLYEVCEILQMYSRYGSTPCHLALQPDCLSFVIDDDGPVTVVDDWGLSTLVEDAPISPYTAPEQLDNDHAAKRTDVYRLGALAAELLGGSSLFSDVDVKDTNALRKAISDGTDIDDLTEALPEGTAEPIRRATARDPTDRYATASRFGRDLLNAVPDGGAERDTNALVTASDAGTDTAESEPDRGELQQIADRSAEVDKESPDTPRDSEARFTSGRRTLLSILGVGTIAGGGWYLSQRSTSEAAANETPFPTVESPEPRWTLDVGVPVQSMVLAGNSLYVGSDSSVSSYSIGDREEEWQFNLETSTATEVEALSVVDGNVHFGHGLDAYTLSASDGSERGRFGVGTGISDPPAVVDGTVYWKSGGSVHARSESDGSEVWNFTSGNEFGDAPVVINETVYDTGYALGSDGDPYGTLYALSSADASSQWRFQTTDYLTAPAVANETAYVASSDRHLYALSTQDGSLQWSHQTGFKIPSPPVVDDGAVYVRSEDTGEVRAISTEAGTEMWKFEEDITITSPFAVAGDTIYFASYESVFSLSTEDGTLNWVYTIEDGGPSQASPLIDNQTVYVGDNNGRIHAIPTANPVTESWPMYQSDQRNSGHRQ